MYSLLLTIHIAAGSISILLAPYYLYKVRNISKASRTRATLLGSTLTTVLAGVSLFLFGTSVTRLCIVLAAYSLGIGAVLYYGNQAGKRSDCPYLSE